MELLIPAFVTGLPAMLAPCSITLLPVMISGSLGERNVFKAGADYFLINI